MTKKALLVLLAATLAATPTATAHGAPEARPIDTRVLTDTTDFGDYGAAGALDAGAWDLLALDVREARLATGAHALVLRVVAQTTAETGTREIDVSFASPNGTVLVTLREADGWTAEGSARFEGPIEVGDGHPKAFDVWLDATALGLAPGTVLEDIRVASRVDGGAADAMPGSWTTQGTDVPAPTVSTEGGTYTLQGPANLLEVQPGALSVDANGTTRIPVTVTETTGTDQFLDLRVEAPADANVTGVPQGLLVAAGTTRDFEVKVSLPPGATRDVRIVGASDLGGWLEVPAQVTDVRPVPTTTTSNTTTAPTVDDDGKDSPGIAVGLGLGALAVVAARRRTRA